MPRRQVVTFSGDAGRKPDLMRLVWWFLALSFIGFCAYVGYWTWFCSSLTGLG